MPRIVLWGKVLWMALVLAIACALPARAGEAPSAGMPVRIQAIGIEAGWHEGRIVRVPNGCTMVRLARPSAAGYTSVALVAINSLEVRREASWSRVPVETLLMRERAECRTEASD
jgi:hypothetical protein